MKAGAAPILPDRLRIASLAAAALCLLPLLLQLPARIAVGIAIVALLVSALSWRHPLPAFARLLLAIAAIGLVLVTMRFAVGRDTGCALLAAMLAIKPSETHRLREARSLVGFALFAPFATFLLDQGPASLLLGLAGGLASLLALEQLSAHESGVAAQPASLRGIGSVARLVAIGLPLALVAFWLFPRFGSPLWGVPERALARPGLSDRMTPGEWLDLMNDDSPALRVQFFGAVPDPSQMYWRGPVLQDFDGRTWKRAAWIAAGEPAPVRRGNVTWDYQLEIEPTDRRELVALELPLAIPGDMRGSADFTLLSPRPLGAIGRWRMQSSPPLAFEPGLKRFLRARMLALPDGYNPRTRALARQWRSEAGTDDAAIVERSLRMIRASFVYTLETPLAGRNSVDEFLFDTKAGFCEHYSSAFVVLMRAAGIPARVVTGYVGGYRNRIGDYWLVRRSDAHAWAEVWLPQRGWVRVDPTAAVAPERIYDTLDDRAPGTFGAFGGLAPIFDVGDWMRRGWNDFVLGFDATRQRNILRPLGLEDIDASTLLVLFATAGGLALAWMLWLSARGERERDPLLRAWRALDRRYARLALERAAHEPAGAWLARIRARTGEPMDALAALTQRFVEWRYASAAGDDLRTLLRDVRRHRPTTRRGPSR